MLLFFKSCQQGYGGWIPFLWLLRHNHDLWINYHFPCCFKMTEGGRVQDIRTRFGGYILLNMTHTFYKHATSACTGRNATMPHTNTNTQAFHHFHHHCQIKSLPETSLPVVLFNYYYYYYLQTYLCTWRGGREVYCFLAQSKITNK